MTALILLFLLAVAFVMGVRHIWVRLPGATRSGFEAANREVRRKLKAYDIKDMVEDMVRTALASAVPSVSTRYLPAKIEFGFHPADFSRWRGYVAQLEIEVTKILEFRCRESGEFSLPDSGVSIAIREDKSARAGKPEIRIPVCR